MLSNNIFNILLKVKNPAQILLRLFNGREFHFKTLDPEEDCVTAGLSTDGENVKRKLENEANSSLKRQKHMTEDFWGSDDPDDPSSL